MPDDPEEGFAPFDLYPYNPSQPAAYAFLSLFGIVGICHLVAMIPYRSVFPLPLAIGCGMEAAAYYFRSRSHDDVRRTLPFIIQNLLVLAAPPMLAASIYMSPRRIARVLEAEHLIIKPRLFTSLFVTIDVACLATQVAGSIMSGSEDVDEASQGRKIIVVGLILHVVAFVLFAAWTARFHVRMRSRAFKPSNLDFALRWKRQVCGLYAVSVLFVTRHSLKLVEYSQDKDGGMLESEGYFYGSDGLIMLLIVVTFLVLHPGRLRMKARHHARKNAPDMGVSKERLNLAA